MNVSGTHDMLGFNEFHKLRVLRVVDMRAERDVVHGKLSWNCIALQADNLARFVEDILIPTAGGRKYKYQLTLTSRGAMQRQMGGTEDLSIASHCTYNTDGWVHDG